MSIFFDNQFDGPTAHFTTPHVTLNAQHPYTDEMVAECLRVIGTSRQSRITRNCRIYIDGALVCPFASRDLVRRITESGSIREVDWSEIFGGHNFLIFINRAALYAPEMLSASKAFVGTFDRRFGRSGISIEHHLIIGHYVETSFGVHTDDPTDRVFHFNLGPHRKSMSLWPRQEFLATYRGDAARLRRTVDHAEPTTYVMPVGSAFFLPADYHHVGSSQEGVSIVVALAFSRQSENLLLREALQELRQLVPLRVPAATYYRDFVVSTETGEDELIARYDRIGLNLAHRHALARRLSNNSFDEIPELELPSIETATGYYMWSGAPIEVVEADEGVYVYSSGHRAFLGSEKKIQELNQLLAASGFEIGHGLGLDAEALALRVWLAATNAARRRGSHQRSGSVTPRTVSSLEPTLIDVGPAAILPVALFAERYGEESVWITGPEAERVENVHLRSIYERWWRQPEAAKVAASTGQVVHWPLKPRCSDELVAPVLLEAEKVIAVLGTDIGCVLDEFRRSETPHYLWAILAPAGSNVKVHQDMFGTASWNLLLSGNKQWTFWAKHKSPHIDAPCTSFRQKPGQIVWIPEDWWHCVTYYEPSLCISKNLVLRRTLSTVRTRVGATEPALSRHLAAVVALGLCEIGPDAVD